MVVGRVDLRDRCANFCELLIDPVLIFTRDVYFHRRHLANVYVALRVTPSYRDFDLAGSKLLGMETLPTAWSGHMAFIMVPFLAVRAPLAIHENHVLTAPNLYVYADRIPSIRGQSFQPMKSCGCVVFAYAWHIVVWWIRTRSMPLTCGKLLPRRRPKTLLKSRKSLMTSLLVCKFFTRVDNNTNCFCLRPRYFAVCFLIMEKKGSTVENN